MPERDDDPRTTPDSFCRYDLRTTDPDSARLFYSAVLGPGFVEGRSGEPAAIGIWLLHERARARGAPAHWLGHIRVGDVEASARRLLDLGSEALGPSVLAPDGAHYATMRDPLGAVISVRSGTPAPRRSPVAWHQLHTRDLERSWSTYADLFGWRRTATLDVADPEGGHRIFAWDRDESVGSMANTARWPGVHPHWLFYFEVPNLDEALASVQAHGGRVIARPDWILDGRRLAPCDDPQGAAFGLLQSVARANG